jgi:hypothetical protein
MQLQKVEQLIYAREHANNLYTASGADLDALVKDRLPEGRLLGDRASGSISFISNTTIEDADVVIPAGTEVAAQSATGNLLLETTEEGTIPIGSMSCTVSAEALLAGTQGNIIAYAASRIMSGIAHVDRVENSLAFSGGTDGETDVELLDRYIYTVKEPGRATETLIVEHLLALANVDDESIVYEARIYPRGQGDVELVIDCAEDSDTDVGDCIKENIAAGITARGCMAATIAHDDNDVELADCAGGKIWIRPTVRVATEDSLSVDYTTTDSATHTATATIPAGTPRGTAIEATLEDPADLATEITAIPPYTGTSAYDVLIGRGDEYPYLFNKPEHVLVDIALSIILTATPEVDLEDKIEASIAAFLNQFKIGEELQYSDLMKAVLFDVSTQDVDTTATMRPFQGIDQITSLVATATEAGHAEQTSEKPGDLITVEDDARMDAGTMTITVVT